MVTLRKITLMNRQAMFNLAVDDEQKRFVASNLSSVASCYVLSTNGGWVKPMIIYNDDVMVGFVMLLYGITGYEDPGIADGNYCVLRLMIDKRYQGHGYGTAALYRVLDYVRTFPAGPARYCWLSVHPDNVYARRIYEHVGFVATGEIIDEADVMAVEV